MKKLRNHIQLEKLLLRIRISKLLNAHRKEMKRRFEMWLLTGEIKYLTQKENEKSNSINSYRN